MLKLDAINQMLSAIGQSPVTTIIQNQHPDVLSAIAVLNRVDRKVQSKGWWFNTDYGLTLAFNPLTLEVVVPMTTLGVEPSDSSLPYVQRGTRLYDYINTTFELGVSVDVDIKQLLIFENLPESAAAYIAAKASLDFVIDVIGDNNKIANLREEVRETKIDLKIEDIKYSDITLGTNPSVQGILSGIRPANVVRSV